MGEAHRGRGNRTVRLVKDKYGVSWQIVPTVLEELMSDPDPEKTNWVMQALLQMKKIEINGLKRAYERG